MQNLILYATTVLIWGSTWLVIKFQLGTVDPMVAVAYRFTLASAVLLLYCRITGLKMCFTPKEHLFMALQGLLLFCINYWLVYLAETHLTSGLVATVFSTIVFMNIINGALLLGSPMRAKVILGAGVGLVGVALVFWPELSLLSLSDSGLYGLLLGVLATYSASLGNITSARNQRHQLPVIQTNAFGMGYGAVIMVGLALVSGTRFSLDPAFAYVGSLLYLAVFGSVVAFGCFLTLVGRIGADRAAYAFLLFPIVALGISTVFEGYQWTGYAAFGVVLITLGNVVVLRRPAGAS